MQTTKVMSLWCSVKNYHWGKRGSQSLVGRLAVNCGKNFVLKEDEPYAEVIIVFCKKRQQKGNNLFLPQLWMGTHPSGPAYVTEEGENGSKDVLLSDLLKETPGYSGTMRLYKKFGPDFPFLLKVLSVNEPLSIQSHPDKKLAAMLHSKDPENYPDDNHKPEMAIALSDFEALCSFRPHHELQQILSKIDELRAIISNETLENYLKDANNQTEGLKSIFAQVASCNESTRNKAIDSIFKKFQSPDFVARCEQEAEIKPLFLRVHQHYPQDIGCLWLFFLNYLKLKPGEAIFLAANEPHCYLSGECVECMAKSDNVVRAGFTPKFKDVQTLCQSLTYKTFALSDLILNPDKRNRLCHIYEPPVEEFAVEKIELTEADHKESTSITFGKKDSGSIVIVIKGELCRDGNYVLRPGSVIFIAATISVSFLVKQTDLLCFRAYTNGFSPSNHVIS